MSDNLNNGTRREVYERVSVDWIQTDDFLLNSAQEDPFKADLDWGDE